MKNKLTKLLAIIVGIILCLTFIACDDYSMNNPAPQESNQPQEQITGDNVFVIKYEKIGEGKIKAVVSLAGNVKIAGFSGTLNFDSSALEFISASKTESTMLLNSEATGALNFSCAGMSDLTAETELFIVEFAYSGSVNTQLDLVVEEASDASFNDVVFSCNDIIVVVD